MLTLSQSASIATDALNAGEYLRRELLGIDGKFSTFACVSVFSSACETLSDDACDVPKCSLDGDFQQWYLLVCVSQLARREAMYRKPFRYRRFDILRLIENRYSTEYY